MKRLIIALLIIISLVPVISAGNYTLQGNVYDLLTAKDLPNTKIKILSPDSTLIAEQNAYYMGYKRKVQGYVQVIEGWFSIDVPDTYKNYILEATHENYEPLYHNIDLSVLGKNEFEVNLPPLYLTPEGKTKDLDDVVVKATKIKFYNRGDTIVYNADAFQLPEGSMLDALIAQLPGVEIKDGGKIYVNGKYVESLLLNGKDFFKGNPEVMKRNIGAYTVKNIEVYEKYSDLSRLIGKQIDGDSEYVMDVKLKKDYMGGFLGNAAAGYGTHGRYFGRIFAMMFNNVANFGAYVNVNNNNEISRPAGEGFSTYTPTDQGVSNMVTGGLNYGVDDMAKIWSVGGNVDLWYTDKLLETTKMTEYYLKSGNTFESSVNSNRDYSFGLSTKNSFKYSKPKWYIKIDPDFRYNRSYNTGNNISTTFDKNVQDKYDVDLKLMQALYSSNNPTDLKEAIVNRNNFIRKNRSNTYTAHLYNEDSFKIPNSPDALIVWIEGEYTRQHNFSRTSQLIDYGYNGLLSQPVNSLAQQRTTFNYPYYDMYAKGAARYYINRRNWSYSFCYEFRHEQTRKTNEEFLFESLADNQEAIIPDIYTEIADLPNSSRSKLFNNIHKFKAKVEYSKKQFSKKWDINTGLGIEYHLNGRHLNYLGYTSDASGDIIPAYIPISRLSGNFQDCSLGITFMEQKTNYQFINFNYRLTTGYAPLTEMVDLPNNSDPLNRFIGNPNLKNSTNQSFSATFFSRLTTESAIQINSNTSYKSNSIVRGYNYDTQTGVREYRSYNTSGDISHSNLVSYQINLNSHFYLNPWVEYIFNRYANMIGIDGPAVKQTVFMNSFSPKLKFSYTIDKKLRIQPAINYSMQYSHSSSAKTRTSSLSPQLYAWYKIGNFEITADYSFTKMYGLADKSFKDSYHSLSAWVSYILNSNWSMQLRAIDILNTGNKPTLIVNSTGRYESFTNSLPRYFMLSVAYKFNTKKK